MAAPNPSRVFVSYARQDGQDFARNLRHRLADVGLAVWHDRSSLEGGKDWWDQIDEALNQVEHMVLVMTPAALQSEIVRKEWRLARQRAVCVIPVFGVPQLDLTSLPRWMSEVHFVDTQDEDQWSRLVHALELPCSVKRVPFMADGAIDQRVRESLVIALAMIVRGELVQRLPEPRTRLESVRNVDHCRFSDRGSPLAIRCFFDDDAYSRSV
jgi:hypothetical protein